METDRAGPLGWEIALARHESEHEGVHADVSWGDVVHIVASRRLESKFIIYAGADSIYLRWHQQRKYLNESTL